MNETDSKSQHTQPGIIEAIRGMDMTVRCIAINSTRRLGRGMAMHNYGVPVEMPVGAALLGRMLYE